MIRKVVSFEGDFSAEDITYEVVSGSTHKTVDAEGKPVPLDSAGIPLVDTHVTAAFPEHKLVAKLQAEGETLTVEEKLEGAKLDASESPKAIRTRLAAKFLATHPSLSLKAVPK
jgi:hypothetical protein